MLLLKITIITRLTSNRRLYTGHPHAGRSFRQSYLTGSRSSQPTSQRDHLTIAFADGLGISSQASAPTTPFQHLVFSRPAWRDMWPKYFSSRDLTRPSSSVFLPWLQQSRDIKHRSHSGGTVCRSRFCGPVSEFSGCRNTMRCCPPVADDANCTAAAQRTTISPL